MEPEIIMNAYMNQYQNNQVLTASPEQILIMLYDGTIRFVRQAMQGIETGDLKSKLTGVTKALNIITEFRKTLDHKIGGELAADLDALYEYMSRELVKGNVQNSTESLKIVEGLLVGLRETWMKAIEINRKEAKEKSSLPVRAAAL
jgi:flagellar protein FliS